MNKILTLNNISVNGLERLPRDQYEIASEIQNPDAILLRSFKMHDMAIPESLLCVGRAGAGVNNIPLDAMSDRGIAVFNAPGANANAVKELVIAGMLIASRNICQAWEFTSTLDGDDATLNKAVEQGKKDFAGFEIAGRTLGVIGLGAIGRLVANAALSLGMKVIGFDPGITVQGAWKLSSNVQQATSVDDLLSKVDFVTFHVPLIDSTKNMINAERIGLMKKTATILNFARGGIVDDTAVCNALQQGKLNAYICDFPSNQLKGQARVIALPHLGASTAEAEDNCAIMVAEQVRDFLENGNITNSVNFPEVNMPRAGGNRIAIANKNVPNMVGQITTCLANANLNIIDLLNKSKGENAYTLIDVEGEVSDNVLAAIESISGILKVRAL
ncbi:MAG: phosphoglycerate dehydrogenase [Gammaproteobacteria bacterium]|nr:phosphoglycerate dehydrogenase [Gammaproteobacteria bacterium]MDH5730720.1 phosphoglycerate dehydrogenase [Gammaproteobacteria bacterium]